MLSRSTARPTRLRAPGLRLSARASLPVLTMWGVGHVLLAIVARLVPVLGLVHALACLVVGVVIAARRPLYQVAYVVAYIAGAEVLWRMTRAGVFWEYGKYAVCVVLLVAMARVRLRRNVGLGLGYLGLLLPSIALTISALSPDIARQQISFNISGPLSLAMCILFFSNIKLTSEQVTTAFFSLIGPVIGIAALTYFSTMSAQDLEFTGQSNSVTSGGFGPNQVSAVLGLALLFCLLMLLEKRQSWRIKAPLLVLAVAFAVQAALTFSRGGIVMAALAAVGAMFYLVRDSRARVTLFMVSALLFSVGRYVVIPRLEVFTQGKLSERYLSTKSSNRNLLATNDLELFADNPLLGVGPGMGASTRSDLGVNVAAHTEFTRVLGEHGIPGMISLSLLVVLGLRTTWRTRSLETRAVVVAMMIWFTLFLAVNAMRLVAPSFAFGLACALANSSLMSRKSAPS